MFSLQRLLGKEDKFFDLLEASAQEARNSVKALIKLSQNPSQTELAQEYIQARRNEKQIRDQITEAVYTTFVTALEREDIETLSHVLYRIPKTVEKFGERMLLTPVQVTGVDFSKQLNLLEQATDVVQEMVHSLRQGANLEEIRALNDKMQTIEGDADKIVVSLMKELLNSKYDPIKVIILKDLYELLEKIIDRCRDAGNVITHIVLKNS
jgi:uncharacterized protein Yka (UPF0111/DUF47 family)